MRGRWSGRSGYGVAVPTAWSWPRAWLKTRGKKRLKPGQRGYKEGLSIILGTWRRSWEWVVRRASFPRPSTLSYHWYVQYAIVLFNKDPSRFRPGAHT